MVHPMKLNPFETVLVNNPLRTLMLARTVDWLYQEALAPPVEKILEIGCGQGDGLAAIARRFHPRSIDGFDLDERQVARAERRLRKDQVGGTRPRLWTGDAEHIQADDGTYDAVFEFTIFHHVPDWRGALREVRRVLRPGGLFLFEELSREAFYDTGVPGWLLRRFTVHPWETMFNFPDFRRALGESGLRLTALQTHVVVGWHHGVAVRD